MMYNNLNNAKKKYYYSKIIHQQSITTNTTNDRFKINKKSNIIVKEFPLPPLQVISTTGRLATGTQLLPCCF